MIKPFEASQLKIDRAKCHFQELRDKITAFFATEPFVVVCEHVPEMPFRTVAFRIRIRNEIPVHLAPIIGDIIHNLRTSLDLLACDLVRITSGPDARVDGVYYPFCSEKSDLDKTIKKRRLHLSGRAVIKAIEETAPYRGGNDGLRAIHDLDVQDKHQALIPMATAASIPASVIVLNGKENQIPQWGTKIGKDGQMMVMMPADFTVPAGTVIPAEFHLIFDEGTIFYGSEIVRQIDACITGVEKTLDLFKSVVSDMPSSGSIIGT